MLYVPGSETRKLARIPSIDSPAFILDLEDAVAIALKAEARRTVAEFLGGQSTAAPLYVRVNSVASGFLYDDLEAVTLAGLTGIVLPKTDSARDIHIVDWILGAFEHRRSLDMGSIEIIATIETATGLLNAASIAGASSRLRCFGFGAGDFSLDLGLEWPAPSGAVGPLLLAAKVQLVLVSRQCGLQPPHDGVYPTFKDQAGLLHEAQEARALGFYGKHAIHPDQIPIIAKAFTPSTDEIDRAREIVTAFEQSEQRGVAAAQVDGRLVDYPVVERARLLLQLAEGLESHPPTPRSKPTQE
jgi:citrate lyase subunit beta / citryl-CoA lyase